MRRAWIQPTGDELLAGVIEDTDSPMVCAALEEIGFQCMVAPAVQDDEGALEETIWQTVQADYDLMVLIGGSGGGRRHDPSLSRDVTHCVMDRLLTEVHATALYGKNGHLWSRLVCGRLERTRVVNVPGPYREAQAAIQALTACGWNAPLERLNQCMAQAVYETYCTK